MKTHYPSFYLILVFFWSCAYQPGSYSPTSVPPPPDYADQESWAALPAKADMSDRVPGGGSPGVPDTIKADVFFLHPTTYTKKGYGWNASISDAKINEKTDRTTILYQASIFNAAGQVYAPRYRQAHLQTFFTDDLSSAGQALDLAYADIRRAFQHYLSNYNNGRPVIIAAHSQGALHGRRLLQEFFDGTSLQPSLVAAYLVGWPISRSDLKNIPPCSYPAQTGCICSWRTFRFGHISRCDVGDSIIVTNPLTWTTHEEPASRSLNAGAVIRDFDDVYPNLADAQIYGNLLWAHKPRFPGSIFFNTHNYHVADLNFYYMNVRTNAVQRVQSYFK